MAVVFDLGGEFRNSDARTDWLIHIYCDKYAICINCNKRALSSMDQLNCDCSIGHRSRHRSATWGVLTVLPHRDL